MVNTEASDVNHPIFMNYVCAEVRIKFSASVLHYSYMNRATVIHM
jgi:hypothetical protein